jgi:two-component system chemotaxis response regulator CheY
MLTRLGFEAIEAVENAAQAIQKLEQNEFGLLISDWQMDGMTGLELLNKIRETPTLQHIPAILVSAQSNEQNAAAAKSAGAQAYLIKPFRLEILKSTIKEAFDARDALELKKTGRLTYKGCTLIPQMDHNSEYQCHVYNRGNEMTALPANASQQGAIDEAKLWVDQISLEPKPANVPAGHRAPSAQGQQNNPA